MKHKKIKPKPIYIGGYEISSNTVASIVENIENIYFNVYGEDINITSIEELPPNDGEALKNNEATFKCEFLEGE